MLYAWCYQCQLMGKILHHLFLIFADLLIITFLILTSIIVELAYLIPSFCFQKLDRINQLKIFKHLQNNIMIIEEVKLQNLEAIFMKLRKQAHYVKLFQYFK
jgi:hypothetical protein